MKITAKNLCKTHPGASDRRKELIIALCKGCDLSTFTVYTASEIGRFIVGVANTIIEEIEQ
jgi:hypothetical protein